LTIGRRIGESFWISSSLSFTLPPSLLARADEVIE
jgi:hypothetical protein